VSYNVDHVEIVASNRFCIPRDSIAILRKLVTDDDLPEICFLDEIDDERFFSEDTEEILHPKHLSWCGSGSGWSVKTLETLLSHFSGSVDLVLTWEGGDSFSGLRLVDGKVTRHDVLMSLGSERG